ncbi:hypothetical protein [Streptomyces sp. NPDC126499]|uniref:hypothetical protein n=1 Tax=Streptomyces sp. NPDC126499 TaxID=3155314 RepID=UPI003332558C
MVAAEPLGAGAGGGAEAVAVTADEGEAAGDPGGRRTAASGPGAPALREARGAPSDP